MKKINKTEERNTSKTIRINYNKRDHKERKKILQKHLKREMAPKQFEKRLNYKKI